MNNTARKIGSKPKSNLSTDEMEAFLLDRLGAKISMQQEEIKGIANLFDAGLDSFAFFRLVSEIEKKFDFRFSQEDLLSPLFSNVAGMLELICKKVQ